MFEDKESIVEFLLNKGILCCESLNGHLSLSILVSDYFIPAADFEPMMYDDVEELYKCCLDKGIDGVYEIGKQSVKTRLNFVSNSSSSSFVVIRPANDKCRLESLRNRFDGKQLIVNEHFGNAKFGWGPEEYYDFGSKIIFAFLQAEQLVLVDANNCAFDKRKCQKMNKDGKIWMKMLEKVIKDVLGVSSIRWNITSDLSSKEKYHAYIDHQSSSIEGANTEIFENELMLKDFLFSDDSYIQVQNDNENY